MCFLLLQVLYKISYFQNIFCFYWICSGSIFILNSAVDFNFRILLRFQEFYWPSEFLLIFEFAHRILYCQISLFFVIWERKLSLCNKHRFLNSYLWNPMSWNLAISISMHSVWWNNQSLKYIKCLHFQVAKIYGKENLSLWKRLNSFTKGSSL